MIGEAIVGFIDILGYKTIVENHMSNIEVIRGIEDIIRGSVTLIDKSRDILISNPEYKDYYNTIIDVINVRCISDSVLFTLYLSKIAPAPGISMDENILNHVVIYFTHISMFCPLLIAKTGFVLRGGISIGPHYENEFNSMRNNLFIFSKAYVDAFELEKKAKNPRIIIDNNLFSYLKNISFKHINDYFYKDVDGKICFDFYCFLKYDAKSKNVLIDIKKAVTANIKRNCDISEALDKLKYFVDYHNSKVSKGGQDFNDLVIEIDAFKER